MSNQDFAGSAAVAGAIVAPLAAACLRKRRPHARTLQNTKAREHVSCPRAFGERRQ